MPSEPQAKSEGTLKWWQWILIYPTFGVALLGSLPTLVQLVQSIKMGVPFGRSSEAAEQNQLWIKNRECVLRTKFTSVFKKDSISINSLVCESGDVLLAGNFLGSNPSQNYHWVAWSEIVQDQTKGKNSRAQLDFIESANASEVVPLILSQQAPIVLCQRWREAGRLIQRIKTPNGCFDQVINTFTGLVIENRPAPCTPEC